MSHNLFSLNSSTVRATREQAKTTNEIHSKERKVILQPITLRFSNEHNIYSVSKLKPRKLLNYRDFLSRYADHPRLVRICFFDEEPSSEDMMLQKSRLITAYNFGLGCWHIVIPDESGHQKR